MFEVRNIAFSYRTKEVLKDVSFVVSPGETVCIVGGNGVGKTTLLKVLSTVIMPEGGSVRIDGKDAFRNPLKYRRELGFLQENPALYDDMSVKAYLTYRARLKGEPDKRIRRRIGEAAEICRLKPLLTRQIRNLSFGDRKRVALADAILLRPRVVMLDDVLAGLDTSMREAAGEIISSVAAFSNVIVTGHEISDLAKWTTRFLVLESGRITASIATAGMDAANIVSRVEAALKGGVL